MQKGAPHKRALAEISGNFTEKTKEIRENRYYSCGLLRTLKKRL